MATTTDSTPVTAEEQLREALENAAVALARANDRGDS
jgi:hypothetical protein